MYKRMICTAVGNMNFVLLRVPSFVIVLVQMILLLYDHNRTKNSSSSSSIIQEYT